jgi:hypothetical protein
MIATGEHNRPRPSARAHPRQPEPRAAGGPAGRSGHPRPAETPANARPDRSAPAQASSAPPRAPAPGPRTGPARPRRPKVRDEAHLLDLRIERVPEEPRIVASRSTTPRGCRGLDAAALAAAPGVRAGPAARCGEQGLGNDASMTERAEKSCTNHPLGLLLRHRSAVGAVAMER